MSPRPLAAAMTHPWLAYSLRMALAATFVAAGLDHIGDGGMAWAVRWFPWPEPAGWALAYGELLVGLGLAAAALFALSAGLAAFIALGAAATVAVVDGALLWQNLAMAGAAAYLVAHGPGPASLDEALARRWPRTATLLTPWRTDAARARARAALRLSVAFGLAGAFLLAVAQGSSAARLPAGVPPLLGVPLLWVRPLVAGLLFAGAAPRLAGAGLALLGLANLALFSLDYHGWVPLVLGLAMVRWPETFRGSLFHAQGLARRWRSAATSASATPPRSP